MSDFQLARKRVLSIIATLWVIGIAGSLAAWTFWLGPREPTVEVEHWATGHLMREVENIRLLPVMAEEFNQAGHRTQAGTRIVVKVHNVPSELIAEYLTPRVKSGGADRSNGADRRIRQAGIYGPHGCDPLQRPLAGHGQPRGRL